MFGAVCRNKRGILLAVPVKSNTPEVCVERTADSGMGYLIMDRLQMQYLAHPIMDRYKTVEV